LPGPGPIADRRACPAGDVDGARGYGSREVGHRHHFAAGVLFIKPGSEPAASRAAFQ
jgi:hypothetical protein